MFNSSDTIQDNIRILRGWAKSKGWIREPNQLGKPERWGILKHDKLDWRLKIKPEASLTEGLKDGSRLPRFDARLNEEIYINPFTGNTGNKSIGTHIKLETKFYE